MSTEIPWKSGEGAGAMDGPKEGLTTHVLGSFDAANDTPIKIDLSGRSKGTSYVKHN